MSEFHYALGLDIGIGSVGWAVLRNQPNGEPDRIQDLGVRIFDKAEQPKTGASLAAPRRDARSARRRLRRHRHRLERIRYLMEQRGIMPVADIQAMYAAGGFQKSPYQLRAEALDRPLTKEEAVRVLIHLAQRRGYKSNSTAEAAKDEKETGKVKTAIEENRRCMAEHGYRTVGEMMYRDERFWQKHPDGTRYHQTRNKAEDYRFTVERAAIVDEVRQIFAAQRRLGTVWMDEDMETAYLSILESQRSFDEGPGGDSPFSGGIGERVGACTFEPDEKRAAKATYTFEYFKLLQDLSRMRLTGMGMPPEPLDAAQREVLKSAALRSASLSYGQIRKKLNLDDDVFFHGLYYGEKTKEEAEKRKWPQMQSYHKMRTALDKVGKGAIGTLTEEQLNAVATILTECKSDAKRIAALREAGIPPQFDEALLPLSFSKYGSLSVRAMQKLIPLLEEGLRYDEACTRVYGDHRGLRPEQRTNRLSLKDMEEITNPVVRRAVSQTIKVINAVVRTYGPPDVVRIELAREMSRTFDERRKMEKRQDDNRAANERAKDQIAEYKGDHATGLDIVKFKLYREQDGVCLYSGQNLDIARLFEPGYADVDHIIPYSRCFDDSYQNKVLVLASENRQKGNRLPYEYFGQDEARWHGYEVRVENLIHNYRKRQKLLKRRLTEEESTGFIDRNLKDTQYIARAVYNLIRDHLAFAESAYRKKPVQAVNGAVTAMLRGRWGVQKIREDGDLHHCLDAAVIAATTPGLVQRLTAYNKHRETWERPPAGYVDPATGELIELPQEARRDPFPKPWERFRQELEARLDPIDPRHQIDLLKLETYESDEEIRPVFVSRMPNHKVTGAAHAETIRSSKGGDGFTVTKTPLTNLKLNKFGEIEGYYNPASDTLLYDALLARLKAFGGDGAKAFAQPFYKPKKDGTPGPRVDKVKICEKATVGLPVRDGIAANGSMVRIDVFCVKDDGYYFVPIYVADTKKESLPNKAVVAYKAYSEWKEMKDENFIFSLYPGDLVRIQSRKGIKLNLAKGGTGEKEIVRQEGMYYYRAAGITVGAIQIETHDRRYLQPSLGIKTLQSIEKYQVDVLGNYYKVDLPEKRMPFSKEG
nr:type II CRISPR RNA-guided endonuclease Cas9 [uncultured Dysosmobacter sp.]